MSEEEIPEGRPAELIITCEKPIAVDLIKGKLLKKDPEGIHMLRTAPYVRRVRTTEDDVEE